MRDLVRLDDDRVTSDALRDRLDEAAMRLEAVRRAIEGAGLPWSRLTHQALEELAAHLDAELDDSGDADD